MTRRGQALLAALLPLLAVLTLFSGCGDDEEEQPGATTPAGTEGAAIDTSNVPELEDGKLIIGSDIAYAPIEYFEEGTNTPTGMDVDLATAMADLLGAEVEFQQVADFAGIVGDLKSKRYDIIMSAISITPEREAEIDFIPYFGPVGTGILVKTGNPDNIQKLEDLCGRKVAAQVGTYQVDQMTALNDGACKTNPIDIQTFPDNPAAVQDLTLGRVVAELADDPVAAYTASQSEGGLVELVVTGFEAAPYGIGVRKDSTELKRVLQEALDRIIANGSYRGILTDWGQEQFALQ